MNTCETCAKWHEITDSCDVRTAARHGNCSSQHLIYDPRWQKFSQENLVYWDAESYHGLSTGPKFGCVHWKPKPKARAKK